MAKKDKKLSRRAKIKLRIRKRISGTAEKPRLSVFRSNREIYAQLINDLTGTTIAAATSLGASPDKDAKTKATKTDAAREVGKKLAEKAREAGIENVVFDRNGYLYHGRVKSLAEGAREGGLKF